MTQTSVSFQRLLAKYWLEAETRPADNKNIEERLRAFAYVHEMPVSQEVLQEACQHLSGWGAKGDIRQWVVTICFWAHPHGLWNFMLDAMTEACTDDHLHIIACELAEHQLAHHGSMIPHYQAQARLDLRFRRMLTGVWRHRMSDEVWVQLREIQAQEPDPLPNMIPLELGVEYGADRLSEGDRQNADKKGFFSRDGAGEWQRVKRP